MDQFYFLLQIATLEIPGVYTVHCTVSISGYILHITFSRQYLRGTEVQLILHTVNYTRYITVNCTFHYLQLNQGLISSNGKKMCFLVVLKPLIDFF